MGVSNHTTSGSFANTSTAKWAMRCGFKRELTSVIDYSCKMFVLIRAYDSKKRCPLYKLHDVGSKENLPLTARPLFETCLIPIFNTIN